MITYICPNCDNEVDLGDECGKCKPEKITAEYVTETMYRLWAIEKEMVRYCEELIDTETDEIILNGNRWKTCDFEEVAKACRKAYNEIETLTFTGTAKGRVTE